MQISFFSSFRRGAVFTSMYIALLYGTLPITPGITNWMARHSLLKPFIAVMCLLVVLLFVFAGRKTANFRKPSFWLTAVWIGGVYYWATKHTVLINERLHLWLYAVLGFLLFSLFRFKISGARLFLIVLVVSFLLGALDEGIQYLLPNRFFGWHDMALNGLGGATSLLIIRFVLGDKGEKWAG
jgi:hypothetical protein